MIFLIIPPAYSQTGTAVPELTVLDDDVTIFLKKWQIPGAAVAVAQDDQLLYARGFGQADENLAMRPDHLFRIASLSKPITAMAIMKLIQDDILCIDDQVFGAGGVLSSSPFLEYADKRVEQITIQHLLEHTAGWDRDTSPEGDPMFNAVKIAEAMNVPAPADALSIIRYMLRKPLDFTPGTQFSYSNLGYNILGRIIEEVTQNTYEAYVQNAILQPLGITTMALGKNNYEDKNPLEVRYFDLNDRKVKPVTGEGKKVPLQYGGFNLEAMDAHGGWIASAPDLIKLMASLDSKDEAALLKPETVALMTTPTSDRRGYAMGWFVNPKGNWWHTGALTGSATLMAHIKDGKKWVLLLNARPEEPDFYPELDRLMWDSLSKVHTWPDKHLKDAAAPLVVSSEEVSSPTESITQPLQSQIPH